MAFFDACQRWESGFVSWRDERKKEKESESEREREDKRDDNTWHSKKQPRRKNRLFKLFNFLKERFLERPKKRMKSFDGNRKKLKHLRKHDRFRKKFGKEPKQSDYEQTRSIEKRIKPKQLFSRRSDSDDRKMKRFLKKEKDLKVRCKEQQRWENFWLEKSESPETLVLSLKKDSALKWNFCSFLSNTKQTNSPESLFQRRQPIGYFWWRYNLLN